MAHNPQEDLATSGYKPDLNTKTLIILLYHSFSSVLAIWQFNHHVGNLAIFTISLLAPQLLPPPPLMAIENL
jgi:hypothetical protein